MADMDRKFLLETSLLNIFLLSLPCVAKPDATPGSGRPQQIRGYRILKLYQKKLSTINEKKLS